MTSVFIGVPSHDMVPALFAYDLAQMFANTDPSVAETSLNLVAGTYVHCARQAIAERALLEGASHILWIDSDMRFPCDALVRLLAHDRPMVGINYSTRSATDAQFVAIKRFQKRPDEEPTERLVTHLWSTGLEDVEGMGFGLVLMRTEILSSILQTSGRPFFGYEWIADRREWWGEDFYFCRKARAAGIPMQVDHDLSRECSHIGATEFRLEHARGPLVPT